MYAVCVCVRERKRKKIFSLVNFAELVDFARLHWIGISVSGCVAGICIQWCNYGEGTRSTGGDNWTERKVEGAGYSGKCITASFPDTLECIAVPRGITGPICFEGCPSWARTSTSQAIIDSLKSSNRWPGGYKEFAGHSDDDENLKIRFSRPLRTGVWLSAFLPGQKLERERERVKNAEIKSNPST